MSNNPIKVARTTITRDIPELDKETGNIYESVSILSKRADQISMRIREELAEKMEEFNSSGENLEEVYENREQIEMSKAYERMPKPGALAIQEMLEGKIYWRRAGTEGDEAPAEA
ncbi:MAG: DNA-directed RNA polymerase subunit omega [Flavobacteriales bacterium]|jgi:DNA-directed RNA polymerase subunit K/omega|nr:DNA-directed RNA polymerase subunit omega [Flavobacteriales bacterium]